MGQYIQTLAHQQALLHQNQHQVMEQMAALSFNQSNAGHSLNGNPKMPSLHSQLWVGVHHHDCLCWVVDDDEW